MKHPKWKQRAIKAKADLEDAERAERYRKFWESVQQPQYTERHSWHRDANGSPLDFEDGLPIG